MPNAWARVNAHGFNGWVMDYDQNQAFAGQYRLHAADLRLERLNVLGNVWTRWDAFAVAIPVTLASLATPGSQPYDVNYTITDPTSVQVRGTHTHFAAPRQQLRLNYGAVEHSYYVFRFAADFASAGGNLVGDQAIDTSLPVRLPLGAQSAADAHAGFGIFHVLTVRGQGLGWSVANLFQVIHGLLSGQGNYVRSRLNDDGSREWWIVSGERKRGLGGGRGDRSWQRWQLVLKEGQGEYVAHTLINAADSHDFRADVGIP